MDTPDSRANNRSIPTFDDIETTILSSYPLPIASVFRKCRAANPANLGGRHKNLVDLFEATLEFICVLALQDIRIHADQLLDALPQKEDVFQFLKRPTTGGWAALLRRLCKLKLGSAHVRWASEIADWYNQPSSSQIRVPLSLIAKLEVVHFEKRARLPNAEVLNALVTYRNKLAHGANPPDKILVGRLETLEKILTSLLTSMSFLRDMRIIFVDRAEATTSGSWIHHVYTFQGVNVGRKELGSSKQLELHELYVVDTSGTNVEGTPVRLAPFLRWRPEDGASPSDLFFYVGAGHTILEYLSYATGHRENLTKVDDSLKELANIELQKGIEETDRYLLGSDEERARHAADLFRRGRGHAKKGNYEYALRVFEKSNTYERVASTFLEIARVQEKLSDPGDEIRHSLECCLELEPHNSKARTLLSRINANAPDSDMSSLDNHDPDGKSHWTILHIFTPPALRKLAILFWCGIIVTWYTLSLTLDWLFGSSYAHIAYTAGLLINCLAYALGIFLSRTLIAWLESPLEIQLSSTRGTHFREKVFRPLITTTFGSFQTKGGKLMGWASIRKSRIYFLGLALYPVVFIPAYFITGSAELITPLALKRIVDHWLVAFVMYPNIRYAIGVALLITRYSTLPLKPMLTRGSDNAFRALGTVLIFNLAIASTIIVTYWLPSAFVNSGPIFNDAPSLIGICLFYFIVSFIVPLTLYRAALAAKTRVMQRYGEHLEESFRDFVEHPDESRLQEYEWLAKNQKVVRSISAWPLSWWETVFVVVGSNLLLLAVLAAFVTTRVESERIRHNGSQGGSQVESVAGRLRPIIEFMQHNHAEEK